MPCTFSHRLYYWLTLSLVPLKQHDGHINVYTNTACGASASTARFWDAPENCDESRKFIGLIHFALDVTPSSNLHFTLCAWMRARMHKMLVIFSAPTISVFLLASQKSRSEMLRSFCLYLAFIWLWTFFSISYSPVWREATDYPKRNNPLKATIWSSWNEFIKAARVHANKKTRAPAICDGIFH